MGNKIKWKVGDIIFYEDREFIDYLLIAEVDKLGGRYRIIPLQTKRFDKDIGKWINDKQEVQYIFSSAIPGYKLAV